MSVEFIEDLKMIGILWVVVVGYIISGTASGCFVKHEKFDIHKLSNGIVKAIIACANLIIIAYILTIVDLSSLGFNSSTIINSGIVVYCAKILKNSMYLLGITKDGKENSKEGSILDQVGNLDGSTEDIDPVEEINNMVNNISNEYDLDPEENIEIEPNMEEDLSDGEADIEEDLSDGEAVG